MVEQDLPLTPESVVATCNQLREAIFKWRARHSQGDIVDILTELGRRWSSPDDPFVRRAAKINDPFPFVMTKVSLDALIGSLRQDTLWALIDSEEMRSRVGPPLIGHVIAGNTPLLAWTSLLRALLVGSASCVKLPSGGVGEWAKLFKESLQAVSPELARCIALMQWVGGTQVLERALCKNVDLIAAYGSDETLADLRLLCPQNVRFVGFGHRISMGIVPEMGYGPEAALGFADDVLIYDQGGCLSPQAIYVIGNVALALQFANDLAEALRQRSLFYPSPIRPAKASQLVREARTLAAMEPGTTLYCADDFRWTVICRESSGVIGSPTYGVIYVQAVDTHESIALSLFEISDHLQGCAIAGEPETVLYASQQMEKSLQPGITYYCSPGEMQAPPLSWKQDGKCVLKVFTA